MNQTVHRTRVRTSLMLAVLLGGLLALLPATSAQAAVTAITVTAPAGGESLVAGQQTPITWTGGVGGKVKIELYKGATRTLTVKSSSVSPGTFTWAIPLSLASATGTYTVKVSSLADPTVFDDSASFTIDPPVLSLPSPNGGQNWVAGSSGNTITWTWTPAVGTGNVRIDLLKGGATIGVIKSSVPANPGTYNWSIPMSTVAGIDYRIRVTSLLNPSATATSAGDFQISYPNLAVPAQGGTPWMAGTTQAVTWTNNGTTGNLRLDLLQGGSLVRSIKTSVPAATGTYSWNIPIALATQTGTNYAVRATSTVNSAITATSSTFTISLPTVGVVQPNTNVSWASGSTGNNITWSIPTTGRVRLDLLLNGSPAGTIAASVPASPASYAWTIPQSLAAGTGYAVKITSLENPALTDTSDVTFTVTLPTPTMNTPGTGTAGANLGMTWANNSVIGNVRLDLLDGSAVVATVKSSISATAQAFTWGIPISIATQSASNYKVKITSLANPAITASSGTFAINLPTIAVTSPTGGPTWKVGSSQAITWSTAITSGTVKLSLLKGGVVVSTIRSSAAAPGPSFSWTLPIGLATASGTYAVRVSSVSNPTIFGDSTTFTIDVPVPVVATPAASVAGTTRGLSWTTDGLSGNVRLELILASDSSVVSTVKSTISAGALSFNWDIPVSLATASPVSYKIRLRSLVNAGVISDSGTFTLTKPTLAADTPAGPWARSSLHNVTWTTSITVGTVNIVLLKGGIPVRTIKAGAPAALGTFGWTLPGNLVVGTDYAIRITAVGSTVVTSDSGVFTVS
ncbi:MAG: Na-Ca exchanger/integrin-beta4 [Actinomycetia bacterium]|nr:Na-Ca exchanger/integrin-beta4 [Actinomycetes bacterium]